MMLFAEADLSKVVQDMETMKIVGALIGVIMAIKPFLEAIDYLKGKKKSVHVTGSIEEASRPATLADVVAVKKDLDAFRAETVAQHNQAAVAAQKRVTDIGQVVEAETKSVEEKIDHLADRVNDFVKALHERVNEVTRSVDQHSGQLPMILRGLESSQRATEGLNKRLDDMLRLARD